MSTAEVRHPLSRHRVVACVSGESATDRSHRDAVNINNIIARFDRTGILPGPGSRVAQYGDVTHLQGDLTEMLEFSRTTLDSAGKVLEESNQRAASMKDDKIKELENQISQLRADNEANGVTHSSESAGS